ncbi:Peptide chain release factor 1, mitochondrial [Maublancomyces gigas]|uniref:Peptide chain release factor 1, mitochondrial n=1 Tax=Discina gigas TaxID=1032678 RepID=A0ABR3GCB8_9PEZI
MLLRPVSYVCHRCTLHQSIRSAAKFRFQSTVSNPSSQNATLGRLPGGLLRRAQELSKEHRQLERNLSEDYNKKTATRAGQLAGVSRALKEYEDAINNLKELHEMVLDSSLDTDLRSEAASDIAATEEILHTLSTTLTHTLVPPHPFAHLPALLEVRPGTGGSEASLFANDLLRMYTTYCTSIRNWPISIVSQTPTSEGGGGITEAIFEVDAPGAYDLLRVEAGVHRVQRVPATEKQGRTHTSTATVMVLPSFPSTELAEGEEDPESIIDMKDVRVDIMRARGAGGQHVNTTDSAVRMTHLPTGLVAAIQDSRSQHKNREKCLQVLKSRVAEKRRMEREAEELSLRRGVAKVGAGRADKLRTYNYIQNRVTDHRCGFSLHDLPSCMDGSSLGTMMEEVRKWQMEQDVKNLDPDARWGG